MLKKSEIKNLREKYILGLRGAPKEIKNKEERLQFRIGAIYALGEVLELPTEEKEESEVQ